MKNYTHAERANAMFELVYGIPILIKYVDDEDSDTACQTAMLAFAQRLFEEPNTNPLRAKHKKLTWFLKWFDKEYPSHCSEKPVSEGFNLYRIRFLGTTVA